MVTKTITKLSKFEGKPLVETQEVFANFLIGDFGKAALKEYKGRVRAEYDKNKALNVLYFRDNVVKGSKPYAAVLMNQVLGEEGIRVATPADLQRILDTEALDWRGTYEDAALVLRSEAEPNSYLARNLTKQIRERNGNERMPVIIPLVGLELERDSDAPDGLAFKLKEDAEIIYAPILNKKGNFSSRDVDRKTGLPKELGNGERYQFVIDSGLSRLTLYWIKRLAADWGDLKASGVDGRIVGFRDEATPYKNN